MPALENAIPAVDTTATVITTTTTAATTTTVTAISTATAPAGPAGGVTDPVTPVTPAVPIDFGAEGPPFRAFVFACADIAAGTQVIFSKHLLIIQQPFIITPQTLLIAP
jgi:hypothetical protein